MQKESTAEEDNDKDSADEDQHRNSSSENHGDDDDADAQHVMHYGSNIYAACEATNATKSRKQQTEEEKREKRLEANRRSAKDSRNRRKRVFDELQRSVARLSEENAILRKQNEEMSRQMADLKQRLGIPLVADADSARTVHGGASLAGVFGATAPRQAPDLEPSLRQPFLSGANIAPREGGSLDFKNTLYPPRSGVDQQLALQQLQAELAAVTSSRPSGVAAAATEAALLREQQQRLLSEQAARSRRASVLGAAIQDPTIASPLRPEKRSRLGQPLGSTNMLDGNLMASIIGTGSVQNRASIPPPHSVGLATLGGFGSFGASTADPVVSVSEAGLENGRRRILQTHMKDREDLISRLKSPSGSAQTAQTRILGYHAARDSPNEEQKRSATANTASSSSVGQEQDTAERRKKGRRGLPPAS